MKKIGILTFHRAENFGAVLQAYALQQYVTNLGYDVEIIDYRCKSIERQYDLYAFKYIIKSRRNIIMTVINYIMSYFPKRKRKKKFEQFREQYFKTSNIVYDSKNINKYDILIFGSDQIWNPAITGGLDQIYWGDFDTLAKKISYASSCERMQFITLEKEKEKIKKILNSFYSLSCRENTFAEFLGSILNRKPNVVIDPTFLIKKDTYEKMANYPRCQNYVLVYHITESKKASDFGLSMAKAKGKKIVEIHVGSNLWINKKRHLAYLGPLEILGYISNADFVVTTSFHGMALSLILHKQFVVISKSNNERMKNLLGELGLLNNLCSDCNFDNYSEIDYIAIEPLIKKLVYKSFTYLNSNLHD